MVAMPIVLHTRLTGRVRVRRTFFGRYVVQVEETSFRKQLRWPPAPGAGGGRFSYEPPADAPRRWRDAREDDSWLLAKEGLL